MPTAPHYQCKSADQRQFMWENPAMPDWYTNLLDRNMATAFLNTETLLVTNPHPKPDRQGNLGNCRSSLAKWTSNHTAHLSDIALHSNRTNIFLFFECATFRFHLRAFVFIWWSFCLQCFSSRCYLASSHHSFLTRISPLLL